MFNSPTVAELLETKTEKLHEATIVPFKRCTFTAGKQCQRSLNIDNEQALSSKQYNLLISRTGNNVKPVKKRRSHFPTAAAASPPMAAIHGSKAPSVEAHILLPVALNNDSANNGYCVIVHADIAMAINSLCCRAIAGADSRIPERNKTIMEAFISSCT